MIPHVTIERRREPRFPRCLPIRFGTAFRTLSGTIVDISKAGLRIRSRESLLPDADVIVFVVLELNTVCLHARVAWVNQDETLMGLSLTPPQPTLVDDYEHWLAEVEQAAAA